MKKTLLSLIIVISLLLSSCQLPCLKHKDSDLDGLCDKCGRDAGITCVEHTDDDGNTVCDVCKRSVIISFDFYSINDLHGMVTESAGQPGIAGLSSYLADKRADADNMILLSTGDMWQGSSESNLTYGALVTDWMNELGFTSMTLGNHEFDWGEERIEENAELAEFPMLAINVYDKLTNERIDYCYPSTVIRKDGVSIGIIGAIGDVYSSISYDCVKDVYFKVGDELTELVKAESERLRGEGVDYVIYALHDGYSGSSRTKTEVKDYEISSYYDIELSDGYVDLVFEGHTHSSYILEDSEDVLHMQAGGQNDGISCVKVDINAVTGEDVTRGQSLIKSSTYEQYSEHPVLDNLLEKYAEAIAPAYRELGYNSKSRSSEEIKQLVARLYYEFGVENWGDEYELVLGGGYLSVRYPYRLYSGTLKYSDLYSVLPFDNTLVLCSISGYDLYYRFIVTENEDYYVHLGEWGESVKESIDLNATYYLITDTYTSTYAPNNLTEIERYDLPVYARDLLADYVESGGLE